MLQRKPCPTREQENDDCRSLEFLQSLGIPVGSTGLRRQPKTLDINVLSIADTVVCELMPAEVAVIVPLEIVPLRSRAVIQDCHISFPWESSALDLHDAEASPWYGFLVNRFGSRSGTILNHWVTGQAPVPHKVAGVILGFTSVQIPLEFPENMPMHLEITFTDDRGGQYCLSVNAKLDRGLRRQSEQRLQRLRSLYVSQRTGPKGPNIASRRTNQGGVVNPVHANHSEPREATAQDPQPPNPGDDRRRQK